MKFLRTAILFGALLFISGCSIRNLNFKADPLAVENESAEDFCGRKAKAAEQQINAFVLNPEYKKYYEIWKKKFVEYNRIDDNFFAKHVFPSAIYIFKQKDYTKVSVRYYLKFGDIYLPVSLDYVSVNSLSPIDFESKSINELLNKTIETVSQNREPQPDFGYVPKQLMQKYEWGIVEISNIHFSNANIPAELNCKKAVEELRRCSSDITPEEIVYKPALGYAWVSGFTVNAKKFGNKNVCAGATFDLVKEAVNSCSTNISCSRVLGL